MSEPTLAANWWLDSRVQRDVYQSIRPSICRLLVEIGKGREWHRPVFSGFLAYYEKNFFWVTAGHVLDNLKKGVREHGLKIKYARFLEYSPESSNLKSGVPVDFDPLAPDTFYSLDASEAHDKPEFGLDVCIMRLRPFVFKSLTANKNVKFLPISDAVTLDLDAVAGLYVIGSPSEWVIAPRNGRVEVKDFCLPASLCRQVPADVKSPPGAIVAQLEAMGDDEDEIADIDGMSGGPVIAVEHRESGEYGFRLAGKQSSWLRSRKMIFVSSLQALIKINPSSNSDEGV